MRSFAFCHAAKEASDASEAIISRSMRLRRKPYNSWLALRPDRREKYLNEPSYLKSESKISSICIEFPEVNDVYVSSIWKFISLDISDNIIYKNIYAQSSQQDKLVNIEDAILNIINGSATLRGSDLDQIATLVCCLRVKISQRDIFVQLCAKLAKHLLSLIAKPTKKMTGEILWSYCYRQFIKKNYLNKAGLVHYNEDTWKFVDEYYREMLFNVKQNMYVHYFTRTPAEYFRLELIKDLINAVTCIDSEEVSITTEDYLHQAKSNKWSIKYKAINIGLSINNHNYV